ncbi:hypothetical protein H5410_012979 [Solanum commersonii]|uniref:NIM1-interacting protein n=1 Tax=Solanum commersonii TaxID=4109 RepID=A0A9J6ATV5_SOLCO|nr:hypothetical protein H5410_012979 [Solanum commersonii]
MKISESKKRKEYPEFDDDEEEKMDKFYELIRSFKDRASQLIITSSSTNMPKNTETTQHELVEKFELKKKKKSDDKEIKEEDKSSNHKDSFFTSPQAFMRSSLGDTTRNSPNLDGIKLDVNEMSGYKLQRVSGDHQIHDDTQGLDLNLSL